VLALKINWKDTRDGELADAFLKLIKSLRPRKHTDSDRYQFFPEADFPERPASKKRGRKWEIEAKAALNALIALQKKQALTNAWHAAKAEVARLSTELKKAGLKPGEQVSLQAAIHEASSKAMELGHQSKALTLPGNKRALATACFRKIVGTGESAWWELDAVKSK